MFVAAFAFEADCLAVDFYFSPSFSVALVVVFVDFPEHSCFGGGYWRIVFCGCEVPCCVGYEGCPHGEREYF